MVDVRSERNEELLPDLETLRGDLDRDFQREYAPVWGAGSSDALREAHPVEMVGGLFNSLGGHVVEIVVGFWNAEGCYFFYQENFLSGVLIRGSRGSQIYFQSGN
jgi:hypothetical protein